MVYETILKEKIKILVWTKG